jgi:hypothetical protein
MNDLYDGGVGVYSEAKGEYTKQLILFLTPALLRFFMKTLQAAQADQQGQKGLLAKFQELLSSIPEWNIDKVQRETAQIITETKCDYLEELISAVFIAHTKVLTAIRPNSWKNKRVQIVVPKLDHFIHRALSECSRLLWKSAYLFQQDISAIEKQKNYRGIELQIYDGISIAIRGLLPVKNILKDCLQNADDDDSDSDSSDDEEEAKPVPIVQQEEPKPAVPEPEPELVKKEESVAEVTKPAATNTIQEIKIEKLEEVAKPEPEFVPQDNSGDHVFIAKNTSSITVEKLEAEPTQVTELAQASIQQLAQAPIQQLAQAPIQQLAQAPNPTQQTNPIVQEQPPLIKVDTEPSVKFSDYDQVFTPGAVQQSAFNYVPKDTVDDEEDYSLEILGDASSVFSDFEELDNPMKMDQGDYEEL